MVIADIGYDTDIRFQDLFLSCSLKNGIYGHAFDDKDLCAFPPGAAHDPDLLADRGRADTLKRHFLSADIDDGGVRSGRLGKYSVFCAEQGIQSAAGACFPADPVHVDDMEKGTAGKGIGTIFKYEIEKIEQDQSCRY